MTYFLAIQECKSFSLASHQLCISQSSLSKQIKSLENELDVILFDRNTRNVTLTPAGEEFSIYAKDFIDNYNNIISNMKKFSSNKKTCLNIGAIPVLTQYGITSIIASFKSIYPHIDINIIENEASEIIQLMDKSEIDLAFMRDFNLSDDVFDKSHLLDDELVLVTSKDNPLAKKSMVSLLDAKDENFILLGSKSGIHELCLKEFQKHGFSPNIIHTMYKIETILGFVGENLGVTLLMKDVINSFNNEDIITIPLENPVIGGFSLITSKNKKLSNNEIKFIEFIKKSIKKRPS